MSEGSLVIAGELAEQAVARAFAREVRRVHHRYAEEVVGAFSLCPFMKDASTAFGCFCVMLEREPVLASALEQIQRADMQVVHLVYPLVTWEAAPFERFGNELHNAVAKAMDKAPVHATFHPAMDGDTTSAARLVGFVRRAPDPFVQFIPEGLHQGGSTFVDLAKVDLKELIQSGTADEDRRRDTYARLDAEHFATIRDRIAQLREERHRSYRRFLDALA